MAAFLSKRVNKIEKLLDNLAYLNKSQCAVGIPRSCHGAPKTVYSLRCNTPSADTSVILQEFDNSQRTNFEALVEQITGEKITDNEILKETVKKTEQSVNY